MSPEVELELPLLEHLIELRRRAIVSLVAASLGTLAAMGLADPLYALLTAPVRVLLTDAPSYPLDRWYLALTAWMPDSLHVDKMPGTLAITSSPTEGVYTWFQVVLVGGLLLASPVIAHQAWAFVAPGLYRTERRVVLPLALASSALFALGAFFAYAVLLPVALPFFLTILKADAILSVSGYLQSTVRMMAAFGLTFQLPVAAWFLARIGLIDHSDLMAGFRYAVVVLFFIAALITPPDVVTQAILGVPLVFLYLISIGVAWVSTTKVRRAGPAPAR
ncbi:MAG: twin-arginine translocase subunit TatC [Deltaproteobacteria bacterium]|nr:twin-arginine translocase subunit TatC [Deltaproteobacteria bacterium]